MLRAALTSALHGSAPQATHWKTAWLLRFSGATCPQWEHRCDVYAAGTVSSRPWALCLSRATSSPHPWRLIARLRPRFCATWVPGHSRVPRAERVIARTFKSSTRMVSKRRATSVVVFSTQSRRRSVSRARNLAIARFVRARRLDPRRARPRRCCNRRSRLVSPAPRPATSQQLSAGERHRYRHATINPHDAAITGSRDRCRKGSKSDVPPPRSIQTDAVRLHRAGYGAGPPEPHPPHLGYPYLPVAAAQPVDVARFESDLPESFMRAGLTPRRATVGAVEKVAHRLREVAQRSPASGRYPLLLHGLRPGCQPVVFGAGRSQLGALLVVTRRLAAWLPVLLLLGGQIPHKPGMTTVFGQRCRLLRAGEQPKPAHSNNLGATTDNMAIRREAAFSPLLKPGVSTP